MLFILLLVIVGIMTFIGLPAFIIIELIEVINEF